MVAKGAAIVILRPGGAEVVIVDNVARTPQIVRRSSRWHTTLRLNPFGALSHGHGRNGPEA